MCLFTDPLFKNETYKHFCTSGENQMWMCEQTQLVSRCTSSSPESEILKSRSCVKFIMSLNWTLMSTETHKAHFGLESIWIGRACPLQFTTMRKQTKQKKNTTKRENKLEEQTTELSFHCEDAPTAGPCHQARLNHCCCYSETQQGFLSVICDEMTISKIKTM